MSGIFIDSNIVDKKYNAQLLFVINSIYQEIKIYESKTMGKILAIDGDLQLCERDEHIYHEMMTHVPLMSIPNAENVLIIGGGDGGICREVLKHTDLKNIIQIEIDELVVKTCLEYLPNIANSMRDKRIKLYFDDASKWIKTYGHLLQNTFDVIIMDTTDFNTSNPLFLDDFFISLKPLMKSGGILVFNGDCLNWYRDTVKNILKQQSKFFKYTRVYQSYLPMYGDGHYGYIFSSDLIDPLNHAVTKISFDNKNIMTKYYDTETHMSSFILSKELKEYFYNKPITKQLGMHITIDFSGVSVEILNDFDKLNNILEPIITNSGLKILNITKHIFTPMGITVCYLLTTSHFSIHTWPECKKCCMDLFTCDLNIDVNNFIYKLIDTMMPEKYDIKYIDRGLI